MRDDHLRPISRFTETTVRSALVTDCLRASAPTRRLPFLAMATTEGVRRYPARFGITTGVPACTVATTELVVPRSMPITGSRAVSHAFQENARLLVLGMLGEDQRQLVTRLRLEPELDECLAEEQARLGVAARRDVRGLGGEAARLLHLSGGERAARGSDRALVAVRVDLERLGVGGHGRLHLALVLVLVAVPQREAGAGLLRVLLELDELLRNLGPARIELARCLQRGDGASALAVLRQCERVLIELAGGRDAGEALAAEEALAAFPVPAIFLFARELPALGSGALDRAELRRGLLVVLGAEVGVGENLVRGGEPLEGLRQERCVLAEVLAVPCVGVVPARTFEISASDRCRLGVGADAENLVMRAAARAAGEIGELLAQILGKVDSSAPGILQQRSQSSRAPAGLSGTFEHSLAGRPDQATIPLCQACEIASKRMRVASSISL